jgi:putative DNA methylase
MARGNQLERQWRLVQQWFAESEFCVAGVLAQAKNASVRQEGRTSRVVASRGCKVRLLKPTELPKDWGRMTDTRLTAWKIVHLFVRALEAGGESAAAILAAKLGIEAEAARELTYRLYTIGERKKHAAEALSDNGLIQSRPEITCLAHAATVRRVSRAVLLEKTTGRP